MPFTSGDPFVYALGCVALQTPWFESMLGALCVELSGDQDAERTKIRGANYSMVRDRIVERAAGLSADKSVELLELISRCNVAWGDRNFVMHGIWIAGQAGLWGRRPGRGSRPSDEGPADAAGVMELAERLEMLGYELTDIAKRHLNARRAALGLGPSSAMVWRME